MDARKKRVVAWLRGNRSFPAGTSRLDDIDRAVILVVAGKNAIERDDDISVVRLYTRLKAFDFAAHSAVPSTILVEALIQIAAAKPEGNMAQFLRNVDPGSVQSCFQARAVRDVWLPGIFGRAWPGHALKREPLLGPWTMTEVMATTGIVHFLRGQLRRDGSHGRAEAFVRACLPRYCEDDSVLCFALASPHIAIEAERLTDDNRRCDIWIEWTAESGERVVLVVEAKFDAPDQEGAFGAYHTHAHDWGDRKFLVYLTTDGRKPGGPGASDWIGLSWASMLGRWEDELSGRERSADDEDFHRFRRSLWDRAGGADDY